MNFQLAILITCCTAALVSADEHHWSYDGASGPSDWCHGFTKCCGSRQSPVNFDTNNVRLEHFPAVQFHHYDRSPDSMLVRNNGHSVYIDVNQSKAMPMINDGGMGSNYVMVGFHFHWPAEHTVDGKRGPLELHIVHYNTKYPDLDTAIKNPDGLVVIGVLYELSEKEENLALGSLLKTLPKVKYAMENASMNTEGFSMIDLLPSSTQGFFRYYGSLTTPGCDESVIWTVFQTKSFLSEKQLNVFKMLKANKRDEEEKPMSGNYRPVQLLKGRKVRQRIVVSAASIPSISLVALLAVFTMTCSRNYHKVYTM